MKKTININLGGYAMTIDEDAYQYLSTYLENIKRRFYNSEGRDEILSDIEARMGELISTNLGSRAVVQLVDVESVVHIMGKPEDFGGDPIEEAATSGGSAGRSASARSTSAGSNKAPRRLYRDEEDATVAGVCSGLASYFGIADPVWMRLIFVLLTFLSAGFWLPAYFLLWVLVPAAKTSTDRLSMKGEAINVDNIAREIEEGFDRFGNKVSEFGESVKKKSGRTGGGLVSAISKIVGFFGRLLGLFVRILGRLFKGFGIFFGIMLLFALAALWVASAWVGVFSSDLLSYFSPLSGGQTILGMTNILFLIGLPLLGLLLFFARLFFKFKTPTLLGVGIFALWLINLFSSSVLAAKGVYAYNSEAEISELLPLRVDSDILYVNLTDEDFNDRSKYRHKKVGVNSDNLYVDVDHLLMEGDYSINIERSENGVFQIEKKIGSRGSDYDDATMHAKAVVYDYKLDGGQLNLAKHYKIQKGSKFRDQNIELTLFVPDGKKIQFNGEAAWHARIKNPGSGVSQSTFRGDHDQKFTMSSDGLLCESCPQWGDANYAHYGNLEEFDFDGPFIIEITKGDKTSLRVEGSEERLKNLRNTSNDRNLTLTWEGENSVEPIRISITTRNLMGISTSGNSIVSISGFDTHEMKLRADEQSKITANIDVSNLEIRTTDQASIELKGDGNDISITSSDQSIVDADKFEANHVELTAHDQASVKAYSERHVTKKLTDEATAVIRGNGNQEDN